MKKLLGLIAASAILACNAPTDKEQHTDSTTVTTEQQHDAASAELALNNGNKWKADSVTTHNVVSLKNTADMFRVNPTPALANYQLLGADLTNNLDTLVRQCRMKGADHDALHKWLEPVMSLTSQLKTVSDTAKAREIFRTLDGKIDAYRTYFE